MMKIGLTGPSGSGKTTLATYMQEVRPELKFIPGSAGLIHYPESQALLHQKYGYEGTGHKDVINLSNTNPDFGYDFQRLLLKAREEKLRTNTNFITDRTPLDNLVYFLLQCSHNQTEEACKEYMGEARLAFMHLTHLFIIKPNDSWTENNGSRVANNFYQHMTHGVFIHTFNRYFAPIADECGIKVRFLNEWDLDQRKAIILEAIKNG